MKYSIKSILQKFIRNQRKISEIASYSSIIPYHHAECRRWLLEEELLTSTESGISNYKYEDAQIIVSMTSYGRRLFDTAYTIQSVMRQSMKPNRLILWIDEKDKDNIPCLLQRLQKRGLEIKVYPNDIRSYKKLIPSLIQFPEDIIITLDDDIFYEVDVIERLVRAHRANPNTICALRCHKVLFDINNNPLPYNSWQWNCQDVSTSKHNFLTGVGGVLYPPHSLDPEVLNEDAFTKLAPTADDVWFYCMALKANTPIRKVQTRHIDRDDFIENQSFNTEGLRQVNVSGEALNDKHLKAVLEHYNLKLT